jgi:hypothetical protein
MFIEINESERRTLLTLMNKYEVTCKTIPAKTKCYDLQNKLKDAKKQGKLLRV